MTTQFSNEYQGLSPEMENFLALKKKATPKVTEEKDVPLEAKSGFKFGCDPEFFIVDVRGRPVCPDFIPGTKDEPHKVEFGAVQRDGMAAEFNIDPVSNFEDFNRNIVEVMRQMKQFLPTGHKFSVVPSVEFSEDVFNSAPDDAKELGCSPDFDAWTGYKNSPPCCDDRPYLRTASGHLHVGWRDDGDVDTPQHMMNCRDLVKQLDWYLAAWSLKADTDPTRRLLYGKAGAMRPKPYGVEYRVLSNFWIRDKPTRLKAWNRMQQAIHDMRRNFLPTKLTSDWQELLTSAINTSTANPALEHHFKYPVASIAGAAIHY